MATNISTELYITRCKNIYGTRFDYTHTEYKHSTLSVTITCKTHGEFQIKPLYFLKGNGCPVCRKENKSYTKRDTESFKNELKLVHPEYDYSKVYYVNTKTSVEIICNTHGSFFNTPENLVRGAGCPLCKTFKKKMDVDYYIQKAKLKHKDKYDYSLIKDIKGCMDKVPIICPTHGLFYQPIGYHAHRFGCYQCGKESIKNSFKQLHKKRFLGGIRKSEWLSIQNNRIATLYLVRLYNSNESFLKIGITFNKVNQRLSQIPYNKDIIFTCQNKDADFIFELEKLCKQTFKDRRILPSILFKGYTECLDITVQEELLLLLQVF